MPLLCSGSTAVEQKVGILNAQYGVNLTCFALPDDIAGIINLAATLPLPMLEDSLPILIAAYNGAHGGSDNVLLQLIVRPHSTM